MPPEYDRAYYKIAEYYGNKLKEKYEVRYFHGTIVFKLGGPKVDSEEHEDKTLATIIRGEDETIVSFSKSVVMVGAMYGANAIRIPYANPDFEQLMFEAIDQKLCEKANERPPETV